MSKKILIPGGKLSDWALVNAAHRLGLYVITSGTDLNAPAHKFSDEFVYADYSDEEAMLELAKNKRVDFICSCANDFGMISTAYVCEKLGLPGHDSYETTLTIHNKDRFKPIAKRLGLHSPISEVFDNRDTAISYISSSDKRMIIKPADNVASIGVSVPESNVDIAPKVDFAFSKSKNKKIVVEPFIEGFFVPVTSMIINKRVEAFFTEAYFQYPQGIKVGPEFPITERCTGYQIPAPFMDEYAPHIIDDFNKIARELNLVDGKFHCELLITADHEAFIFDVHRRMSGFFLPRPHWDISNEICWEDWIVRAECGMDLSGFPKGIKQKKYIHSRNIYAPRNGMIKRVVFDEYLSSHIFPEFDGNRLILSNLFVTDHLHDPIIDCFPEKNGGELKFAFEDKEEAERLFDHNSNNFYSHISFEYVD